MSTANLRRTTCARIPTGLGQFQLCHFLDIRNKKEHLALIHGEITGQTGVLTRVHSECFTGDVLGSQRCDCGEQLQVAMRMIAAQGMGIIVYLRQEGRGIGLEHKLRAYNLQDQGFDTVDANLMLGHQADEREYSAAAAILADLQVTSIRLMTNNPDKIESLQTLGIDVVERVALEPSILRENAHYLSTKVQRMRHMLSLTKPLSGQNTTVVENGSSPLPEPPIIPSPGTDEISTPIRQALEVLETRATIHHTARDRDHHSTPSSERPFVTLTYAQALDGSIADADSMPLTLSGIESMRMTHLLRTRHDAILVGIGTVLADDPRLTARLVQGAQPQPVILDTHRRIPRDAALLRHPKGVWLATHVNGADKDNLLPYNTDNSTGSNAGNTITDAPNLTLVDLPLDAQGHIDLDALLHQLGKMGIRRLMVEGGATVIQSFLAAQLVDYLVVTIAPRFVAGRNVFSTPADPDNRSESGTALTRVVLPSLEHVHYTQAGPDTILWAVPRWDTALHHTTQAHSIPTQPTPAT